MATAYKKYGPISRFWLGIFPTFVVMDPSHLQVILGSTKHVEKTFMYSLLHNFLGDGLITSSGNKWQTHRKLLQPTFQNTILETFIRTFSSSAICLNAKIASEGAEPINITHFINECVIDILNGKY